MSDRAEDYRKYEDLRERIWAFPEDHLASFRNMMCENFLHEGSSLFIGAFAESPAGRFEEDAAHLVGFAYGFVGIKDKNVAYKSLGNLWFYSQYLGVRPDFQGYGLGIPIKEFQRDVLADYLGIFSIACTFDPLTGVNAYRNIHHFGMEVLEYRPATYGECGGSLNRTDVPTDRFFMAWDLRKPASRPEIDSDSWRAAGRTALEIEKTTVAGLSGPVELEIVRGVRPTFGGDGWLVRIPSDFYRMLRETDVEAAAVRHIPLEWRLATRRALQELFAEGFRVVDFRRLQGSGPALENYYVLRR
jgi:predicted GNAT superfamily acetyltransferase